MERCMVNYIPGCIRCCREDNIPAVQRVVELAELVGPAGHSEQLGWVDGSLRLVP